MDWKQNNDSASHLWTSWSPRRFVICHVSPLSGCKPGWEISNPCFLTSSMYLENSMDMILIKMNTSWAERKQCKYLMLTSLHWNARHLDPHPRWKCNHIWQQHRDAEIALHTTLNKQFKCIIKILQSNIPLRRAMEKYWRIILAITYHLVCFMTLTWMALLDHSNSSHSVVRPS